MNDKYVTQDDLEMDRRVITLESELTSAIKAFNRNFILLAVIVVGLTYFNFTELSKSKDSDRAFQISVAEKFAKLSGEVAGLSTKFAGLSEEVTELKDSVNTQLLDNNRALDKLIAKVESLQSQAIN